MNEIDLIKEVEKRPILYDKSVSGFNKTKLRDEAWKDVQEALNVSGNVVTTEAECKKRWRSLRDSFIKLQRTHGGRTRWPYHYAMRFLLPHVEPKCENTDQPTTNEGPKHAERDLNYRHFSNCFVSPETQLEDPNTPAETKSEISNKREADDSDAEEEMRQRQIQALPDLSFPESKYEEEDESRSQPSPKKARLNSVDEENPCLCNRTDPDELFLLSCAPTLKRLNAKQNAVARLKIQQVLYEAEFGHQMELPYVTPASECSFDNIEGSVG